jgi:serine/threonine protein kinase
MLTAELPFDIDNFKEEWAHYTPPENLSPACQRLLARLLSTDPSARPTADEALESEWLRGGTFSSSPNLATFKSS